MSHRDRESRIINIYGGTGGHGGRGGTNGGGGGTGEGPTVIFVNEDERLKEDLYQCYTMNQQGPGLNLWYWEKCIKRYSEQWNVPLGCLSSY
ncbi:hypothetical protein MSAN_00782300 [Mycena sanguinolenta]|uniref:Uncharacterized protein n=1 Tax=Mycena sanguinolenta TaxID=230812 RepID=A0A8H6Z372_9AGAR|nr:hypothetical protein MSAN_00782300 [Mycena sanguinolenta]